MNRNRRTIFLVDREVQGSLMLRVASYWLFCLLSISLMVLCWNVYTGPPQRFITLAADLYHRYAPALVASLILLPIVMMDVLRMSNRFVGPVVRLRMAMRELAEGRPAQPLSFRDNDFWRDMATDFNQAAARIVHGATERSRPTEAMPGNATPVVSEPRKAAARS
jgi:hypothetical protein